MLIAPAEWDPDRLEVFRPSQAAEISNMSISLSDEEILSWFGIDSLGQLPEYDALFLKVTINRGRLLAKQIAAKKLFEAMSGRDALPASLAYLTRFGSNSWKAEVGTGSKAPKSIRVVLEE